jgi:putative Mg2+ transporter-C (MgtC) family protein
LLQYAISTVQAAPLIAMDFLHTLLAGYWTNSIVGVNAVIVLNLVGALLLGIVIGYERAFHGRAAGMRTYGLVCMASAALTVVVGYPSFWYGGHATGGTGDPTRVIQGVVTGVGFLGAGVIMKDGFSISGLTTAALIWASSAVGVLVGIGFYAAAILLTAISALSMVVVSRLEDWLPTHPAIAVVLRFKHGSAPLEDTLRKAAQERGYQIAKGSLSINYQDGQPEWRFTATEIRKNHCASLAMLADELSNIEGVISFSMAPARN